tara:strand:- start:886 stop:1698 length:813 start_codon:yes stop_codon:yes gene_type:complete
MFVIDQTKKEILQTLVEEGKKCLLTGATGCGKTTLAMNIAEELGMNPVVINCGSTQDARTSLLGHFTLQNGNTKFEQSDFLKAVQTPNTLIILDELSRASDDAYNILFPVLDHRSDIRVDEESGDARYIKVDDSVKFIATANVGMEYSSARIIDRALLDRFILFNLEYISGKDLKKYLTHIYGGEVSKQAKPLCDIYDYSHKLFSQAELSTRLSTRMIIESAPLVKKFTVAQILDNVLLSVFSQDSSDIVNDANKLREYADTLGVYNESK